MTVPQLQDEVAIISFSTRKSLMDKVDDRILKRGDRSKLISRLLEMWLNDEVVVTLPEVPERKI